MENASFYTSANSLQRREAHQVLEQFVHSLHFKKGSRVLDVGCGSGDVTAEILLPLLPKDVEEVIGVDVSQKMIIHAQKTYGDSRLSFLELDIAIESENLFQALTINNNNSLKVETPEKVRHNVEIQLNGLKLTEEEEETPEIIQSQKYRSNSNLRVTFYCKELQFDVIFSFFCLHWIQNQRQALKNMHKMLKDGGEAILVLLAKSAIFDLYQRLATNPEWSPHMTDIDNFISPYYYSDDPAKDLNELSNEVGFEPISIECRDRSFVYPNTTAVQEAIKAVNPFYPRLQPSQGERFLTDCISIVNKYNLTESVSNGLQVNYKLLVARLRKPSVEN